MLGILFQTVTFHLIITKNIPQFSIIEMKNEKLITKLEIKTVLFQNAN